MKTTCYKEHVVCFSLSCVGPRSQNTVNRPQFVIPVGVVPLLRMMVTVDAICAVSARIFLLSVDDPIWYGLALGSKLLFPLRQDLWR